MALPAPVLIRRGAVRRCPVCGGGGLFRRWVLMRPTCPGCGLRFRRSSGQWLGSWFLNVCVTQAVVVALLVIEVGLSWPEGPSSAALSIVFVAVVVVPVAFFPFSRTIWTAIDLAMRPLDLDDGVAPGVELDQLAQLERRAARRRPPSPRPGRPVHRPKATGDDRSARTARSSGEGEGVPDDDR